MFLNHNPNPIKCQLCFNSNSTTFQLNLNLNLSPNLNLNSTWTQYGYNMKSTQSCSNARNGIGKVTKLKNRLEVVLVKFGKILHCERNKCETHSKGDRYEFFFISIHRLWLTCIVVNTYNFHF